MNLPKKLMSEQFTESNLPNWLVIWQRNKVIILFVRVPKYFLGESVLYLSFYIPVNFHFYSTTFLITFPQSIFVTHYKIKHRLQESRFDEPRMISFSTQAEAGCAIYMISSVIL